MIVSTDQYCANPLFKRPVTHFLPDSPKTHSLAVFTPGIKHLSGSELLSTSVNAPAMHWGRIKIQSLRPKFRGGLGHVLYFICVFTCVTSNHLIASLFPAIHRSATTLKQQASKLNSDHARAKQCLQCFMTSVIPDGTASPKWDNAPCHSTKTVNKWPEDLTKSSRHQPGIPIPKILILLVVRGT